MSSDIPTLSMADVTVLLVIYFVTSGAFSAKRGLDRGISVALATEREQATWWR